MKHKIISYRQDELFNTPRPEYQDEASNDAEATTIVQSRIRSGYTISGWLQDATQTVQQGRKGKDAN
jgi:hypothetical protein